MTDEQPKTIERTEALSGEIMAAAHISGSNYAVYTDEAYRIAREYAAEQVAAAVAQSESDRRQLAADVVRHDARAAEAARERDADQERIRELMARDEEAGVFCVDMRYENDGLRAENTKLTRERDAARELLRVAVDVVHHVRQSRVSYAPNRVYAAHLFNADHIDALADKIDKLLGGAGASAEGNANG